MVEVRLFATFREGREKVIFMELSKAKTPKDVAMYLQIDTQQIAICLINGFHSKLDAKLKDKDVLSLFPPVAGG